MDPEQYSKAKELFLDLVEKSQLDRERSLKALDADQPELVKHVRELLAAHRSRTILMAATGKVSDTTTQSKSISTVGLRRIRSNLVGGGLPIALAVGAAVLLFVFGAYLNAEISRRTREEYKEILSAIAEQKASILAQWVRGYELRLQDWGKQREIQSLVKSLNSKVNEVSGNASERKKVLLDSPEHEKIKRLLDELFQQPAAPLHTTNDTKDTKDSKQSDLKFAIWNRSLMLVSDWQYENPEVDLGGIATPIGASMLTRAFDRRETSAELPRPTAETVTKDYPLETTEQYMMFFVPIFSPDEDKEVIAAMMIRSSLFLNELQELLGASVLQDSNCYLLDDRGAIATEARDLEVLKKQGLFSQSRTMNGAPVFEARDPGGNLLAGYKPNISYNDMVFTKPGKVASQAISGNDLDGYRDYLGKEVIGSWQWIHSVERMLVLELPKDSAFKTMRFIDQAFRYVYGIPVLITLVLGALSFRRSYSKADLTNKSIGAYKLTEKIGEGGLGVVFKAEHKMLGRTAAIKLIKEPFANAGAMRRFEREVRMAAKLSHPNTVSIYDFGVSNSGLPYCAMEMVEGVNLACLISYDTDIAIDRCIWILRQIAGAIEEAHESGLIHRDIKPQNIMVCQRGQLCDLVKVVDFGLAKTMADNISRDATATRVLIGTPGFIAPERLETPWIADPRIDIFAFGVLGIYLLTGKVPILGVTQQSVMQQLQLGRFAALCGDKQFSNLVALLAKSVSPDPSDRPRAMSEIGAKLETLASFMPWNENLAERWWRNNGDDMIAYSRTQFKS